MSELVRGRGYPGAGATGTRLNSQVPGRIASRDECRATADNKRCRLAATTTNLKREARARGRTWNLSHVQRRDGSQANGRNEFERGNESGPLINRFDQRQEFANGTSQVRPQRVLIRCPLCPTAIAAARGFSVRGVRATQEMQSETEHRGQTECHEQNNRRVVANAAVHGHYLKRIINGCMLAAQDAPCNYRATRPGIKCQRNSTVPAYRQIGGQVAARDRCPVAVAIVAFRSRESSGCFVATSQPVASINTEIALVTPVEAGRAGLATFAGAKRRPTIRCF